MVFLQKTRDWYGRFERPISSFSLVLGFLFNILTLRRIDTFWENLWIVAHLFVVGLFIILIHTWKKEEADEKDPGKVHFYFVNILQFFFGGLLSTYLVFYFRSTDIFSTWPFLLLLVLAFIANESFKRLYIRFSFQISLFFLSIYSFAIFIVPIIFHRIGDTIFLLSGFFSLVFITIFITFLFHLRKNKFKESKKLIFSLILGIFVLINFLYFTNLIPPIPLSLKDAGVYHSIEKDGEGNYAVTFEEESWENYFKLYPVFHKAPGEPVYVYSAIFSPSQLNLTILHEWQYYDQKQNKWITDNIVSLRVVGGRDGGFRTYSRRSNLIFGKWRVKIKTEQGATIGSTRFSILPVGTEPILFSEIKQ